MLINQEVIERSYTHLNENYSFDPFGSFKIIVEVDGNDL